MGLEVPLLDVAIILFVFKLIFPLYQNLGTVFAELHQNCILCHLLFEIMQCYIYILYISHFGNKCQIGWLDTREYKQVYVVKKIKKSILNNNTMRL